MQTPKKVSLIGLLFVALSVLPIRGEPCRIPEWMTENHFLRVIHRTGDMLALQAIIPNTEADPESVLLFSGHKRVLESRLLGDTPLLVELAATYAMFPPKVLQENSSIFESNILPNSSLPLLIILLDNHCINNGWYQSLRSALTGKQRQILSLLEDEGRQHGALDAESERLEKLLAPHLSSYAVDKVIVYTLLSRLYRSVASDEEIDNTLEAIMSQPSYSFHALRWYTLANIKIPEKRIETLSLWAFDDSNDWPSRFAAIMLHGAKGDLENFYDKNKRAKLIRELRNCQDYNAKIQEHFRNVFDWSHAMFCLREGRERIIDEIAARKGVSRHLYDVGIVFYPQEYFSDVLDAFASEPESSRTLGRMQPALREAVEKLSARGASNAIIEQLKKLLVESEGEYGKTCILLDAISSIKEFDIFFPVMFDYYSEKKDLLKIGDENNVFNCLGFLDMRAGRNGVDIVAYLRQQIGVEDDKRKRDTMEQMIHDIENVREFREKRFGNWNK